MITFVTFHIDCSKKVADYIAQENILLDSKNDYLKMIDMLFRSASILHPNSKKVVVTDRQTDLSSLSSDIKIHRVDLDSEQVMLSRLMSQIDYLKKHDFSSDIVLLDSDMLINGKLNAVFEQSFDVGMTYRSEDEMPINGGIIFISKRRKQAAINFLEKVYCVYRDKYTDQSTWWGDQHALIEAIGRENFNQRDSDLVYVDSAKLLFLPCEIYNFSPNNKYRAIIPGMRDKKVLHFKGYRKRLMSIYWDTYLKPHESSGLGQRFKLIVNRFKLLASAFNEALATAVFLAFHTFRKSKELLLNLRS